MKVSVKLDRRLDMDELYGIFSVINEHANTTIMLKINELNCIEDTIDVTLTESASGKVSYAFPLISELSNAQGDIIAKSIAKIITDDFELVTTRTK